jgi:DNA-binding transcriptional ArsR family regulator
LSGQLNASIRPDARTPHGAVPARRDDLDITGVMLRALAEPRRRAILRLIAQQELPAGEIAAEFEVTRTAVSQHLTVLKRAALVSERRDGTRRLYHTRPQALRELHAVLDGIWASALERGKALAEERR